MTHTSLANLPHHALVDQVRSAPLVWVPVNPVEYHGPHLPLRTDHLQARAWIDVLHRELGLPGAPAVWPDLEVGVDPTHGPGTRASSYGEVRDAALRAVEGLHALGARAVALTTFHGAPLHNLALAEAVRWCERRGLRAVAPFQEVTRVMGSQHPLFDEVAALVPPEVRAEVRAGLTEDFHAGLLETSLMLHWCPDSVSAVHKTLAPCGPVRPWAPLRWMSAGARGRLREEMRVAAYGLGWLELDPFPGYTGHPALATAEIGARFAHAVTSGVLPVLRDVLDHGRPAPAPPFGWVGPLSLWGRI
ncbi:MAG: creatininase family protein [Myxococcota bacterium]